MKNQSKAACLCLILLYLQGCAVMLEEPTQSLPIISQPGEANVSIVDESGSEIFSGQTPATISLEKGTGDYFGSKTYLVHISKPGYQEKIYPVVSVPNNIYLYGNFLTVYIGWLLVDPFFPNMYELVPGSINTTLKQLQEAD